MNHKLSRDDELELYKDYLRREKQADIAKKFGISQGHVSNVIKKITTRNEQDLAVSTALEFIAKFTQTEDYIDMKVRELEELKQKTDDEKLKAKIIMDQISVSQIILYQISQRKFMQAIQEDTYALQAYMHTMKKPELQE